MPESLRPDSREKRIAWVGLAILVVLSIVTLLVLEHGETLKDDEFGYAGRLVPGGAGYFSPPVGKYIIPLPLLVFHGLLATAGMTNYLPYELVGIALVALNGCLFFVLAVRRIGALALAPTAVLLFFGAASEVVATGTLRLTELMAVAGGLGALICLQSFHGRRLIADAVAGVLLLMALFCHPLGLAFAVGALVLILFRGRSERWRALLVVALPVATWAITWLALRPSGQPPSAPWSSVPAFVVKSAAVVGSGITGATRLAVIAGSPAIQWVVGAVVVLAAAALFEWRRRRGWRPSPLFWATVVALPALWIIEAHAPGGDRQPESPRYIYPGGVLMLLGLCELGAGIRLRAEGVIALATLSAVAFALSADGLRFGADQWVRYSDYVRAEETSIELASAHVDPNLLPESKTARPPIPYHGFNATAGEYLVLSTLWGSAGYTPSELARRPPGVRETADLLLARALPVHLGRPGGGPAADGRGCVEATRPPSAHVSTVVPRGGALLRASGAGAVAWLRRFGPAATYRLGRLEKGASTRLVIPPDSAPEPWRLVVIGGAPVTVCPLPDA